jgi:hypothetical protein
MAIPSFKHSERTGTTLSGITTLNACVSNDPAPTPSAHPSFHSDPVPIYTLFWVSASIHLPRTNLHFSTPNDPEPINDLDMVLSADILFWVGVDCNIDVEGEGRQKKVIPTGQEIKLMRLFSLSSSSPLSKKTDYTNNVNKMDQNFKLFLNIFCVFHGFILN